MPRGRATLLVGGPGSGKTIFALRFLAQGAREDKEPGISVAFEESAPRFVTNASSFGWKLAQLQQRRKLFFLDARRIVFDALDVVLALLPDREAKRREVYRLHQWLLASGLTAIITAKSGGDESSTTRQTPVGFMQFMVDCAVILNHGVMWGASQRSLRVQKYRGSRMGTLRWEKERAERVAHEVAEVAAELKRVKLDAEEAELNVRLKSLQTELVAKQVEKVLLVRSTRSHEGELSRGRSQIKELRGADAAVSADAARKAGPP